MIDRLKKIGALTTLLLAGVLSSAHAGTDYRATFGSQWWWQSAPEARYREYSDFTRGAYLESFMVRGWNEKDAFMLWGDNAVRDDQSAHLRLSRGVRWQLDLGDAQLPHLLSAIGRTPYVETGAGVYRLPDSLQALGQRSAGAAYTNVLKDAFSAADLVDNTIHTEVSTARLRGRPMSGWRFDVTGSRIQRSGHKPYGATFGLNNAIELMEPIHQRTLDGNATASYEKNKVRAQATFGISSFENLTSEMVWDNPARLTPIAGTPSQGRTDLYPDNQVVRGSAAVGLMLPRRSVFSATVGFSQGTQNDAWMPMTINTALPQNSLAALPGTSTDAKMDRLNLDFRLTSHALARASGTLRYNFTHADNQTPEHVFSGHVTADGAYTAGPDTTHPFGNSLGVLGADVDFRALDKLMVGVTYENRQQEHTLREVEKNHEDVFAVRASSQVSDDLSFLASFRYGDRKLTDSSFVDEYKSPTGALTEQPGLRRFDIANRKQSRGNANLTWAATNWLDTSVEYTYQLNDYPDSKYGLTRTEDQLVMAEGAVHLNERSDLSGGYGFGKTHTDQASHQSNAGTIDVAPANDWTAKIEDTNVYAFVDGQWWLRPNKVSINAGYELERVLSDYHIAGPGAQPLPSSFSRRQDARLGARWMLAKSSSLEGRYTFESLDFVDVLKENVPLLQISAAGAVTAIWLGNSTLDYTSHRVELLISHRF